MARFHTLSPTLYFSYSQFMVYDQDVEFPDDLWGVADSDNGFARRESLVSFGTLREFGHAFVLVREGGYQPRNYYERVIAVPFLVTSGRVLIDAPDEYRPGRGFDLPPGHYGLVAAQYVINDVDLEDEEGIDLFFEPLAEPLAHSEILVADEALDLPSPLLETVELAGDD